MMIMNTFVKLFFENNVFIIRNGLSKLKSMHWLVHWIINKLNKSYEIHPKLFVATKYALKDEILKSNMTSFFLKIYDKW
jgi:hypothetical protein